LITYNYFQAFVIGCCIGSFLNVIVYRLPNNLSIIKPGSFCPKCKNKLTWKENIPLISWLIQRGKCIKCNTSISIKYPLVELATGILFVFFINSSPSIYSSSSGSLLNIFISWIFLSLLICISLIDINKFWIPQGLINFGFISGLFGLISNEKSIDKFIDLFFISKGVITAAISFLLFESLRYFAKYIYKKDAIGKGDSKLVAMIALWLGPIGTVLAVGLSYVIAAIYCLIGLSTNFLKFREMIPFAPFLSIGGLIVWYLGNEFIFEKILHI
tara:strand:+ start:595 stop:1410 length:816 start_codon:yes stop_codon:yes gene_type:complete